MTATRRARTYRRRRDGRASRVTYTSPPPRRASDGEAACLRPPRPLDPVRVGCTFVCAHDDNKIDLCRCRYNAHRRRHVYGQTSRRTRPCTHRGGLSEVSTLATGAGWGGVSSWSEEPHARTRCLESCPPIAAF